MMRSGTVLLHQLSRLYGVQTSYYDVSHRRQPASVESLLSILIALGAPIATLQDVPTAWRERQQEIWQRPLEPVMIAWDNRPTMVEIQLPSSVDLTTLSYHLKLESGEERRGEWHDTSQAIFKIEEVEGKKYVVRRFPLPGGLPHGYHRLTLELPGRYAESLIISSPLKAYTPQGKPDNRMWGVFLPLYALRMQKNWGSGNYSDLEELMGWVGGMGGQVVATLPLLAPFLECEADFSPYRPSSRLLWNEFYLDMNRVPALAECPSPQALIASPSFQNEIEALRNLPLVDYKRQMVLKRQVLEELASHLFSQESRRLEDLRRFTESNPVVEDYARFRATCERRNSPWRSWPQPLRGGVIKEGDYDEKKKQYHLYVQWLAHQQMAAIFKTAGEKGLQLYLDLPLGVHPDGYDVWREAGSFVQDAQAGAPPDTVFTRGQNWEFPPLHPQRIREQGYRYVIAYLRHNLGQAGILRIDHVMGLHRLFCIPRGMESSQG
ncbi:MAG: 4-alpha-glucanotransferase, partial [Chloroflexota bacterium]